MRFLVLGLVLCCVGCFKPYHEQMYVPVGTSEIAVLVETINDNGQAVVSPPTEVKNNSGVVEADGNSQNGSESIDYYSKRVVNARMVEIPYYWKRTKRVFLYESGTNGEWQPAARLILVDTAPISREWTADSNKGTSNQDQAIWSESKDSVGFTTGISITARISNTLDAIKFLANYPPKETRTFETKGGIPFNTEVTSLEQIIDSEIRTKIQEIFAYESAAIEMDLLREQKQQIMDKVKSEVVPFFKERGITVTAIGQFGGFKYENPDIQKSIDAVFQAQQDEEVAKAETKAAEQRKQALKSKGEGEAEQQLEIARGKAEAIKLEADAEAEAIKAVADAKSYELSKLQENPEGYLQLKQLEIEMERLKAWDGKYPNYLIQGNSEKNLLLTTPQLK